MTTMITQLNIHTHTSAALTVEESASLCVVSGAAVFGVSRGPKTTLEGVNWDRVV